jgi:hypothetical protein
MKFTPNTCLILAIVLFVAYSSVAQNVAQSSQGVCAQKISEFPALRGLKLNMTRSDLMKVYPLASIRTSNDEIGVITMSIIKKEILDDELKRNLEGINMEFMDDHLKLITFLYDDSVKWSSLPKFVESLSRSLNIPVKYWKTKSVGKNEGVYASCSDFVLEAMLFSDEPILLVQVRNYYEIVVQRKEDVEERKSKSFKP